MTTKNVKIRKRSTIRSQIDYSHLTSIVDQSEAAENTMASIVKKLERGIMPTLATNLFYSEQAPAIKTYQDVFAAQEAAISAYNQLPTEIKQLMGNDYKNLETVLFDPKNKDILEKYNLITQRKKDKMEVLIETLSQREQNAKSTASDPTSKQSKSE